MQNAVKYSDGDLRIALSSDGTITFANTVSGFDAVSAGRRFDRFFAVEAGRNATGLGLSIAKPLTERRGGHITAAYREDSLHISLSFKRP